jgi:hypothetical protein
LQKYYQTESIMSTISNLGNRWSNLYTGGQQNDSKASALQKPQSGTAAALSSNPLDLSKRVAAVGNATVDYAQDFVNSFTQSLFGDDAKGATIDFDSASLDVSSGYAAGVQQTQDVNGVSTAAAFSLTDSSHFLGKGTITTADGRKFDFEVEVQYNYELDAAASQTTDTSSTDQSSQSGDDSSTQGLPTVQLPNVDFPGTLADLFQLIGRNLQTALSSNDSSNKASDGIDNNALRSLSLRLLNLVDSKDTNTYSALSTTDKAKAAAASTDTDASDAQAASTTPAATGQRPV